jgi:hypothetical protein
VCRELESASSATGTHINMQGVGSSQAGHMACKMSCVQGGRVCVCGGGGLPSPVSKSTGVWPRQIMSCSDVLGSLTHPVNTPLVCLLLCMPPPPLMPLQLDQVAAGVTP